MKRERIRSLLRAFGSKETGYRSGWVLGHCPLAPWTHSMGKDTNPSFAVKEGNKKSICKCLSCGFGGDLMDLLFRVRQLQKKDFHEGLKLEQAASLINHEFDDMDIDPDAIPEYGDAKPKTDVVFPEWWLDSFHSVLKFPEAIAYLANRGVSKELAQELDVRFDPLQRRIGFPFRNSKKELMGIQGRALDKNVELRYYQYGYNNHRNMQCWMGEDRLDLDKPVVLLEGPFDYTSVFRLYPNVAASFTSGLSVEKCKRLADASEIITLYDYGSGGNAARKRIAEVFKKAAVTHLIPTESQDDAGNMTEQEIAAILKGHVKLEPFQSGV